MPNDTDQLLQRAWAIMPKLQIEHFERDPEGLINDVLIVNRELVFRFAKSEQYARLMQAELKILDLVRPSLGLSVPTPLARGPDWMVYPLLRGRSLERKTLLGFDQPAQDRIAGQLGAFLYRLHSTDLSNLDWELPATRAPVRRQDWLDIWSRVKDKLYPLLQRYQIQWVEDLFESVLGHPKAGEFQPALIHGDLASYHLLLDEREPTLTGVLDFGMAGLGDPASDIGNLISVYGESFVGKMRGTYPDFDGYLPRARFYAQLLELEWVLLGFETGETFWFTAHLGGARDITPRPGWC